MSTPLDIFGVIAATGQKLVAALYLPSGLATAAGTTITGGTVTGTATIPTSSTKVYLGLTENPTTIYEGSADIAGTALPDTTTRPYTVVARIVASETDMTSYSAISSAFDASTTVAYTRDVPPTILGGFQKSGVWVEDPSPVTLPNLAGMTADKAIRVLVALVAGKTSVNGNSVAFLDTDGSTQMLTITYGSSPGARTAVTFN